MKIKLARLSLGATLIVVLIISSCSPPWTLSAQDRSFRMGFTTWPYAATTEAVADIQRRVKDPAYGDIVALHFMDGVPWSIADSELYRPEDLESVYPAELTASVRERIEATAPVKAIYLAIDPINADRSGIIQNFGGDFPSFSFDSDSAQRAYVNFASYALYEIYSHYMSEGYELPLVYFNYGSEASDLILRNFVSSSGVFNPQPWDAFLDFSAFVYPSLHEYQSPYPGSPAYDDADFAAFVRSAVLMLSVALKSPEDDIPGNTVEDFKLNDPSEKLREAFAPILPFMDMVGVSAYPYIFYDGQYGGIWIDGLRADPGRLPENWLSQISAIAPGKRAAITETGWISQDYDVMMNYSYVISSNADRQAAYLAMALEEADRLQMEFVIIFSLADYYPLWNGFDAQAKLASLTWLSTGLYSVSPQKGEGPFGLKPKKAWERWAAWLALPLR